MHMCMVRLYLRFCQVAGKPEIQQNQKHRVFQKTSCFPEYHQICAGTCEFMGSMIPWYVIYIYICYRVVVLDL